MKRGGPKVAAIGLALLLLRLPVFLSARERRGAEVVVTLKGGQTAAGELIAVKRDALLLLNSAGKDESVDIVGIREIKVIIKSQALKGTLYGFLAGAALGTVAYLATTLGKESYVRDDYPTYGVWAMAPAIPGALIGLGAGELAGKNKTIQLEGKSKLEVRQAMTYLRGNARIRDYR
jgi:hypothetical protein